MAEEEVKKEAEEKKGLDLLSDAALAAIVEEATDNGNFNTDSIAQDAFCELQRRDTDVYGR